MKQNTKKFVFYRFYLQIYENLMFFSIKTQKIYFEM